MQIKWIPKTEDKIYFLNVSAIGHREAREISLSRLLLCGFG